MPDAGFSPEIDSYRKPVSTGRRNARHIRRKAAVDGRCVDPTWCRETDTHHIAILCNLIVDVPCPVENDAAVLRVLAGPDSDQRWPGRSCSLLRRAAGTRRIHNIHHNGSTRTEGTEVNRPLKRKTRLPAIYASVRQISAQQPRRGSEIAAEGTFELDDQFAAFDPRFENHGLRPDKNQPSVAVMHTTAGLYGSLRIRGSTGNQNQYQCEKCPQTHQ
jgi:hypothetical protein